MKNIFAWILLYYLRFFARLSLFLHKPKVIGITGSVGKSSTRNAVHAMMEDYFKVQVIKEGNSETGIPLGILGIDPGHYEFSDWLRIVFSAPFKINHLKGISHLVVEMGIDSPLPPKNMDYLLSIVHPDISVVLNVYPVHTLQFDELFKQDLSEDKRLEYIVKRIAKEKLKIINKVNPVVGIYNENLKSQISPQANLISFGKNDEADIKFTGYEVDLKKTSFKYFLTETNNELEINIKNFALPKGYLEVFAATIAVGKSLELTDKQIANGLEKNFTVPAGRSSIFAGVNSSIIIDSSYNASKASVLTFLEMAEELSEKENRPLVLILGDMRELGQETKMEHEAVAEKIIDLKTDQVFCVGPNMKKYIVPKIKGRWFKSAVEVGDFLRKSLPYRAVILVKGSQNEIFLEEAVKKILKEKSDARKLCRQNGFWLKKKNEFFQGV